MDDCVAVGTYSSVAQKYATIVSQWVKQIWKDKSSPSLKRWRLLTLLKLISKSYAQVIPHLNKKEYEMNEYFMKK